MGIITLILGMTIAVTITLCIVLFLLFQPHLKQHGYLRTPKTKSKHKKKGRNAPKTPLNTPGRPSPERQSSFDVPTTSPIASAEPKSDLPTRKPSSSATSVYPQTPPSPSSTQINPHTNTPRTKSTAASPPFNKA